MSTGLLRITLRSADSALPFPGESVYVKTGGYMPDGTPSALTYRVDARNYDYRMLTDVTGSTENIAVAAPDIALSRDENNRVLPYALTDVYVNVRGYFPVRVIGVQVFSDRVSLLPVVLVPLASGVSATGTILITIPRAPLLDPVSRSPRFYDPSAASPQILERVVIPETVTVHLGNPSSDAENISVPFTEYIKNVASSEIYPTWGEQAIRANIFAIISIMLNRIFSEWYPSQGYPFDITSSTAFDQSFVPGRNIFENISQTVDALFNTYITRFDYINPLFAAYCDGVQTSCDGMSQWGSEELAVQGYDALSILRYYYGGNVNLTTTNNIAFSAESYPGTPLSVGTESNDVQVIRRELFRISDYYPNIPKVNPAYLLFDTALEEAVRIFQSTFDLPSTGVIDRATWYRISYIYSSVTKLAELSAIGETGGLPLIPPTVTIGFGSIGRDTARLQYILNYLSLFFVSIPTLKLDGYYGTKTENAVIAFQETFSLPVTGSIGPEDWQKMFEVYYSVLQTVTPSLGEQGFPGIDLAIGSSGESVFLIQTYLNRIAADYASVPSLEADGEYGALTERAVADFQSRFSLPRTGVVDAVTWGRIAEIYNFLVKRDEIL